MRKQTLIIVALLTCAAGVAAWVVKDEFFFEPGVTVQNFERLHLDMSEAEIEAILGQKCNLAGEPIPTEDDARHGQYKVWKSGDCRIQILFRIYFYELAPGRLLQDDRAVFGICGGTAPNIHLSPRPEPLLAKLRRWIGL